MTEVVAPAASAGAGGQQGGERRNGCGQRPLERPQPGGPGASPGKEWPDREEHQQEQEKGSGDAFVEGDADDRGAAVVELGDEGKNGSPEDGEGEAGEEQGLAQEGGLQG